MKFKVRFFNDTATTENYTLSQHDALPIACNARCGKIDDTDSSASETPLITYSQPAIVLVAAPRKQSVSPSSTQPL